MSTVVLSKISTTSSTLSDAMRACLLRAGLSRARGCSEFVLGNPKAWLGTAYHHVLEKIGESDFERETIGASTDRLWNGAVDTLKRGADAHPLNRRFGAPASWPGYYVARASAALRAQELTADLILRRANANRAHTKASDVIREHKFTGFYGKLTGTPDIVRAGEIVDYKSGAVVEFDETTQRDLVKTAYVRQLRIYGYLVNDNLGWWPSRGIVLPPFGAGIEIPLDPAECVLEATDAVTLLDNYNRQIELPVAPELLASPTVLSCRWCSYKMLCKGFWSAALPDWSGKIDGGAVEGTISESPHVVHGGAARAVSIDVESGSEARGRVTIAPLNPDVHPSVLTLAAGDRVRLVGLRSRRDGVLVPTPRTILARARDLPTIQ